MHLTLLLGRTYARYAVVVTVLSLIVFAPLLYLGMRVRVPADVAQAKGVVRTAWLLVGLSIAPLYVLVGGVTPAVRSIAAGAPASQLAALRLGLVGMVRAAVPCAAALLAIVIGSLAVVVPGLVLLALLALTGAAADTEGNLAARLAAGAAAARSQLVAVVAILVVSIGVTAVGVYLLQRGLPIPLPKQPTPELLATFQLFARYAIAGVAIAAPLPAIALAAIAAKARASAAA